MSSAASYDLVAIEKTASVDYLERIFECYRDGRIAVPIDSGSAAPEGLSFGERVIPAEGGGWFTRAQDPIRSDAPAQISFSSGTTGTPKAILLSHRALADVTDRLIAAMEIDADIAEYLGVPPTYSFGLARARVVAAVGGKLYVPPRGFDPSEFARMLESGDVNALSTVPTLLRVLIANPDLIGRKVARKLRWLEIGSQPMSADDKRAIRRMFPAARIVQHYGLTEASRTTFLDLQEASDEELESVGRPIGATDVRIDDGGHVAICGPHVADGILTGAGVQPIVDGDGWLRTNDLGRIDERGFLHYLGRADHLLNVGGIKVPAELFEQKLAELIGTDAAHVAVGGMEDALRGEVVMVAHLAAVSPSTLAPHVRAVGSTFGLGAADVRLVQVSEIPRTETGKVRRSELSSALATVATASADPETVPIAVEAAATGASGKPATGADDEMSEREREIALIWREALGVDKIARNDTFFDLGGDSLSAINAMLRMERAGIAKEITQQIFEGRSVAQIAANSGADSSEERQPPVRRAQTSDAITMTRGVMMAIVIGGHWLPFLLVRMGSFSDAAVKWTSPLFRAGTPGFAIVYGIGLTFFNMSMVRRHPDRLKSNIITNVKILAGGVAVLAVFRAITLSLSGNAPVAPTTLLYGVLTAYLVLVATSGIMLRWLAARRYPLLSVLMLALVSLILSALCRMTMGNLLTSGVVDLVRMHLTAKYSLLEMLGYVALGAAMGLWIDKVQEEDELPVQAGMVGLVVVLLSAALTVSLGIGDLWFAGNASIQMIIAYAGGVLILFGAILHGIRHGLMTGPFKVPARILVMIGILAFVFYIAHEVATALHGIFDQFNVPYALSIFISVGLFVIASTIAIRRLYRLYYGR